MEKKRALRQGDYKTLNLYFQVRRGRCSGRLLLPHQRSGGDDKFYRDGCNIRFDTITGSNLTDFNPGKTAIHEVGHWFNLFHTFQGGCSGAGDHTANTPAQASASS